jgi:hypothetical protein
VRKERHPLRREPHHAPIADEQRQAGHALKLLHLLRQGGLRQMPAGGGAREMELFSDGDERRKVWEVH